MKIIPDIGPRTWITPLVEHDGGEPDTERWWESDRILLVTSVRGGDMVHMLFYDRDDDEQEVPWGHELGLGPDNLPMGAKARLTHRAEGDEYDRVWTLDRIIGLASDRVRSVTQNLASACAWIEGDGTDAGKAD